MGIAAPPTATLSAAARSQLEGFRKWVAQGRKAPKKTLQAQFNECAEGWCTSTAKSADGFSYSLRLAEKNEWAVRFETTVASSRASCRDLGLSSVLRSWRSGEHDHSYCRFDGGPLKGLFGHVEASDKTRVVVFSKLYADHDPEFRSRVTGR